MTEIAPGSPTETTTSETIPKGAIMATKKLNIKGRFPKSEIAKAQKWGRSRRRGVKVTGITYDPNDSNFVIEVTVEAPTDLLVTQFKGKLG